jgi:hypothetical protein
MNRRASAPSDAQVERSATRVTESSQHGERRERSCGTRKLTAMLRATRGAATARSPEVTESIHRGEQRERVPGSAPDEFD